MPRVFGHYVPAPVVALAAGEAGVVFGSVFSGLALPMIGLQAIRPAWDGALAPTAVLTTLVVVMIHITGLYDTRQIYGRSELLLRLSIAFVVAYLLIAVLGYLVQPLTLARKAFLLSLVTGFPAIVVLRLAHDDDVGRAVPSERLDDVTPEEAAAARNENALARECHDRTTTCRPMTSTSMCVRRKQSSASGGRRTMGSFSLNEVLSSIGTPLIRPKAVINLQYRGFERGLTV